jgi:hypothetical protein
MASLLNVRIGDDEKRFIAELKSNGIEVSAVVRRALREEAEKARKKRKRGTSAASLIAEMLAAWPDEGERTGPHPLDREEFARAIAARVRAKGKNTKARG